MNKNYLSEKSFSSFTVFFIVFFILSFNQHLEAKQKDEFPMFFGHYILKDDEWVEIPEMVTTLVSPLKGICSTWGILGLGSKPDIHIEKPNPLLFIYKQGIDLKKLKLMRLWYFNELPAVYFHGAPPDPGFFSSLCGVRWDSKQYFGKWTVIGLYPFKSGAVQNNPDMIRLQPTENLQPGIYCIYHGNNFTSQPCPKSLNLPVYAFEVVGETKIPPVPIAMEHPFIKIIQCAVSDTMKIIDNRTAAKWEFPISVKQLIAYLEVKEQKGGEAVEFIFRRPDGSIYDSEKSTLGAPRNTSFYSYVKIQPNYLLMPGIWTLMVKIDGSYIRCIDFRVIEK